MVWICFLIFKFKTSLKYIQNWAIFLDPLKPDFENFISSTVKIAQKFNIKELFPSTILWLYFVEMCSGIPKKCFYFKDPVLQLLLTINVLESHHNLQKWKNWPKIVFFFILLPRAAGWTDQLQTFRKSASCSNKNTLKIWCQHFKPSVHNWISYS